MNFLKAGTVGLVGSLFIFIMMIVGIKVTGFAPFNMPPSAAFLSALGLPVKPLAIIIHFAYGFGWAAIAYAIFGSKLDIKKAIALAVVIQWLILMQFILSPIMGWGIFGSNAGTLAANDPMALNSSVKYVVMTLVLHIIYGFANGWLIPKWMNREEVVSQNTD